MEKKNPLKPKTTNNVPKIPVSKIYIGKFLQFFIPPLATKYAIRLFATPIRYKTPEREKMMAKSAQKKLILIPNLKKDEGASVVFISSVAATSGMTFHTSISASKSALEGFARSLAAELAPRVAVNCVAPSLTDTPLAASLLSDEKRIKASEERHPLNAIGNPKALAGVIYGLLSAKENWITGQTLSVDGGLSTLR